MLVEVHDEEELECALEQIDADVIGINNRNLADFSVDIERTFELLADIPAGKTVVSESGFHSREQLDALERVGRRRRARRRVAHARARPGGRAAGADRRRRARREPARCRTLAGRPRADRGAPLYDELMPTRIKHCGITTIEDAHRAAEAGAWALGMIFWDGSPRRCDLDEAQVIGTALRRTLNLVGVFVNARLDEIDRAVQTAGLSHVQLHGDEGPVFCGEVARRTGAKIIKAVRVQSRATLQAASAFHTDFLLLDAHVEGVPGGTGRTIDWDARARRQARRRR